VDMKKANIVFVICLLVAAAIADEGHVASEPASPSQVSVPIEHSFDGVNFFPRGSLSFTNKKAAVTSSAKQLSKSVKWTSAGSLRPSDIDALQKSAATGGRYFIRIPSVATTSVDACTVVASNLEDEIDVLVDFVSAMPLQIDYRPLAPSDAKCSAASLPTLSSKDWKTHGSIHFGAEGPKPQKVAETSVGPNGAPVEEQKESSPWYMSWYIWAIPIVIILMAVCSALLPDEADVKKQL